jgi:hypothetical protein
MTDNISALKDIIPVCMVIVAITTLEAIALMKGEDGVLLTPIIGILAALGGLKAGQYITLKKKT